MSLEPLAKRVPSNTYHTHAIATIHERTNNSRSLRKRFMIPIHRPETRNPQDSFIGELVEKDGSVPRGRAGKMAKVHKCSAVSGGPGLK